MSYEENDPDTVPNLQVEGELLEAVEWLRRQGYLSGEERPFSSLLNQD
jgi:hypothetical protein